MLKKIVLVFLLGVFSVAVAKNHSGPPGKSHLFKKKSEALNIKPYHDRFCQNDLLLREAVKLLIVPGLKKQIPNFLAVLGGPKKYVGSSKEAVHCQAILIIMARHPLSGEPVQHSMALFEYSIDYERLMYYYGADIIDILDEAPGGRKDGKVHIFPFSYISKY